ncbi:thiol reductant ABC exporter subunit CydD [Streptomyces sp. AV19]|uniref:thiol reductant ABC exporter subunit CydD n=1 Tax=Streptomyces sp. AV19 TaxID=2793068 RepID=UPI0018FF0416|nr:thiol reductant ABC exporter subunit CydD [Streptomyces sp. AV19]MBH1933241.1 thiol reductant ABC exporter subunit CydD [Streptomyces sp. AV19]MDG4530659.1 thiol reductant ABC exporter subunit CydD [Streptomyces sp. AV19]
MRPVDPRLLRYASATRLFLGASVVLGLAGAGLVVAQAMVIADTVTGAFERGRTAGDLAVPLALLAATAAGRALVSWLTELAAHRASAAVKSQLRGRLLEHTTRLGPGAVNTGELTTLATRGIDALDDYFARYLPQLGLAVVVPVAVLARIVSADWVSALVIVLTLPLIPLFMALIGWVTQSRMDRQWRLLSRLSGHFLDVVAGLPTLKVFGRAKTQAESIRAITADYRRATLRTLRIAFLSSFALELLSTLSVALVAVGIGMRLVHGELDLYTGLLVLVLAPEAYLPMRQVGAQYHAAAEGLAAADRVFAVLETEPPAAGTRPAPDARDAVLSIDRLVVRHPGRGRPSLAATSFEVRPGETVALTGPSGSGKSTLLNVLLGLERPAGGRVSVGGVDLSSLSPESWRAQVAWVPQRPHLFAGTVAENVRLARPDATDAQLCDALRAAGALDFVSMMEHGTDTRLGEDGAGLSAGQRQRLALARAFLADRPVLLLDEPTANLDGETEAAVVEAVRRLAEGRTVLLVVHRPALLAVADRVVRLDEPAEVPYSVPASTQAALPEAPGAADGPAGHVPADERGTRPRSALARVRAEGGPWQGRFWLALLLGSLALASATGLMAVSGWLISRASQQPPVLYLMVAVTATRAFGIGRSVFRYAERLVSHDAVLRALAGLRVSVYRRLERLAPAGLRDTRRGDLLSRLVGDVDALQDYFLRWLLPVGSAVLVGGASVGFMTWLLPEAGAVLAAGLLAAGVAVPALSAAVARRAERRLAPVRGELSAGVVGLLSGTAELTVAGALPARLAELRRVDGTLTRIARRASAATALGAGLTTLATGLTVAAAAWAGVTAVHDGRLDGVWLAVVVLTPLAAFEAVTGLPVAVQHRQRVRRSAERVYEVLDAPEPVRDGTGPAPSSPFPLRLTGVTARYPGRTEPALRDFGLELTAGRRVAVVGRSGAGKTTLAQVLLRFLDADAGAYALGGQDTAGMDGDAVRRLVGLCAQDAHLFDSSVRENLRLARPDADDARLREALRAARLLDWVEALPRGLDTLVGEHGAQLSGGQRQRLALARALLADFPVLVLDEPAEHLDVVTADALTADLLAATEGRTTVLITHRLAGLEAVDEVIVLDGGRVVERGTYGELAAADGTFRSMLERERAEADMVHPPLSAHQSLSLAKGTY